MGGAWSRAKTSRSIASIPATRAPRTPQVARDGSRASEGADDAAMGTAGDTAFSLGRQIREKVWSAAKADDAGPAGRVDDVIRRDYFPSARTIAAQGGRRTLFTSLRASPPGDTNGEDRSQEPHRRARRRRDDPDHLAVHQGPADPPLPRRRARVLRPRYREPRRHQRPDHGRRGERDQAARGGRQVRDDHPRRG